MTDKKQQSNGRSYRRLLSYLRDLKTPFIIAILGNLLYAAMDVWFISLTEVLTDEGLIAGKVEVLKLAPVFIVGIIFVRGIASIISVYCMDRVGQTVVQKLREQLIENYIGLSCYFFDKNSSGELISKVTFNTQQVANASSDAITKMVREGGSIIGAIGVMFYTNWRLASIFFLSMPVIAILVGFASKRFKKVSRNIQDAMGGVTQTAQEIVEGYKVVKTFGGEAYETKRFSVAAQTNRRQQLKLTLAKAVSVPLIQLIAAFAMAGVIFYSAIEMEGNSLTPGEFVAMMLLMMFILKPLKVISNVNVVLQQGIAAAESIFEILDFEKEKDEGTSDLSSISQSINFSNVSFKYPESEQLVLKNISFEAKQGETVAFVGKSGSGKSTLTNLLLRFYEVSEGAIEFDDKNINQFKLASLRNQIAYVSQQVVLFNDTVKANIAYGEKEIDEQRLIEAAKKAHALEFVEKMPNRFDTYIGENGSKLSGGQRQRLAIARAIYKSAPIIILDEATSALDTESERHIQAALDALTENRTTFVIAHRLSTIERADKIIVMEEGEIVEQGDHRSLLEENRVYAKLQAMQFSE
ncbi:lipid A export permease/ATP-binding protein MsbA [Aliikangiella sp. G2MR2-5]|uniref:lipid A export permease/ATP-binding protein MsbA n=1 Tax=Aliikangiella sp. G2MR2-5 TaxID=2788943 RepID=UPI0018AB817F|nr:lipid A export permease/ATP-binding protein MsbA [Aliikangiella sp. G2MR2-5]